MSRDWQGFVRGLRGGKQMPGAGYWHVSALPQALRSLVKEAAPRGRPYNVVKVHRDRPVISLLNYPRFHEDAFPALADAWTLDLETGRVAHRAGGRNPPILHRKELMLERGCVPCGRYAALTRQAEERGLFRDPAGIGHRDQWASRLRSRGVRVVGHRLRPNPGHSAATSLAQVPALFRMIRWRRGTKNADLGGGRYDLGSRFLAARGVNNIVYDPGNRPRGHNEWALAELRAEPADTATIANVLNVIRSPAERERLLRLAARVVRPGGSVFIMSHEGDGSGVGRPTSKGWQANRTTDSYIPEVRRVFGVVERHGRGLRAEVPR